MICRTGKICIVQSPTMNFIFHNFKLELYIFCEPCPYALIHPVELGNNPVFVPRSIISQVRPSHSLVQGAKMNDELWMAHVNSVLQHDTLPEDEVITWSVYNSRLMNDDSVQQYSILNDVPKRKKKPPADIGVLPLFPDKAASPSMIKHAMQLTMQGR